MHFCRGSTEELNPWLLISFLDWIQTQKEKANSHRISLTTNLTAKKP